MSSSHAPRLKTRKYHSKSRRGCHACKKRHVKCDEQGPPCANCIIRKSECVYPPPKEVPEWAKALSSIPASGSGTSSLQAKASTSTTGSTASASPNSLETLAHISRNSTQNLDSSPSSSASSTSTSIAVRPKSPNVSGSPALTLSASLAPSAAAFSTTQSINRLVELELMHRWSTRTWTSIYFIPGEQPFLQTELPRLALRNSYIMDGLLATSAIDLAIATAEDDPAASKSYLCTAIELSNRASADFRVQLQNITKDNLYILYYFATLAAFFNFAAPSLPLTPLQQADMLFAMMAGAVNIGGINIMWLIESPTYLGEAFSQAAMINLELFDLLDYETTEAIGRISSIIRLARLPPRDGDALGTPGTFAIDNFAYKMAAGQIKYAFAEGEEGLKKGNCLIVLSGGAVAGPDFVDGVRAREDVAIFLLMYWGVLVHRTGIIDSDKAWWIGSKGRDLVAEISDLLMDSALAVFDEAREAIAWTRLQVGLPPLAGCVWPGVDVLCPDFLNVEVM